MNVAVEFLGVGLGKRTGARLFRQLVDTVFVAGR